MTCGTVTWALDDSTGAQEGDTGGASTPLNGADAPFNSSYIVDPGIHYLVVSGTTGTDDNNKTSVPYSLSVSGSPNVVWPAPAGAATTPSSTPGSTATTGSSAPTTTASPTTGSGTTSTGTSGATGTATSTTGTTTTARPAVCRVPAVAGRTLRGAEKSLLAHHCTVGRVLHRAARRSHYGEVLAARPGTGRRLADGAPVTIVVSTGKPGELVPAS